MIGTIDSQQLLRLINVLIAGLFGWSNALLVNYFADTASRIPYSWKPTCIICGHEYSVKDFLFGADCPNCSAKRTTRYFLVFMIVLVFYYGAWHNLSLQKLDSFHFIGVFEFFLLGLLLDLRYHKIHIWFSLIGLPLAISVSVTQLGATSMSAILGGFVSFLLVSIAYGLALINHKITENAGVENLRKPDPGIIAWATVAGIMVGFPRILFSVSMVIYILGLVAIAALAIKTYYGKKKRVGRLVPYGTLIILGTLLTYLLAV
ncbi:MAG: hypothetical protein ACYDH2_07105 [Anaerolineaceae bacterium]